MEKLKLKRSDLAKVFPDHRMITAFEKLFIDVDASSGVDQELINSIAVTADSASSAAGLALALIDSVNELIEANTRYNFIDVSEAEDIHEVSREESSFVSYLDFDLNSCQTDQRGRVYYGTDDTINICHKDGVIQQVGDETFVQITNNTGVTILNGTLMAVGSIKYNANGSVPSMYITGVATQDILNGQRGRLTAFGRVRDLNTSLWASGSILYADPAVLGGLTSIKPTAPNIVAPIGVVVTSHATQGEIFVRPVFSQQQYFGTFVKTSNATLPAINTATAISLDTTVTASGVIFTGTQIKVNQSGLYTFNVSFQLASTNSSIKDVYLWFRKNGVNVANTTIAHSLESGTAKTVQSRSFNFSLLPTDYIELFWGSPDTGVSLSALPATSFSPATPSVILNVTQIQQ